MKIRFGFYMVILILVGGCGEEETTEKSPEKASKPTPSFELRPRPSFNADSAYAFIEHQVNFGPRVPNTSEHVECARWLESELIRHGMKTNVQEASVVAYNGQNLNIFNIMGQYNPTADKRILLCAHWDSRPYADRASENIRKPIDGANDGASGVGVLLEIARALNQADIAPNVGVDIVFFDAEDYGKPQGSMIGTNSNSWCLGSQYWAQNLPIAGYDADFGILLDMVGASNAVFPKEAVSMHFAPNIVNRVWKIAAAMGHTDQFLQYRGNEITDDHLYLNDIAKIPTIDIIHYELGRNDFGTFHHTHDDNMSIIDKNMLQIVGDVVTQVLYNE